MWIGMFAKDPVPGQVKTRLAEAIGAEAAAGLYRCFVLDLVDRVSSARVARSALFWAVEGGAEGRPGRYPDLAREFADKVDEQWFQEGQDLGDRLKAAFARLFGMRARRAVILGTDSPNLPKHWIERALARLDEVDVVVGPTRDGGYSLIGLTRPMPELFEGIPWGTGAVLQETLSRLSGRKIPHTLLPPFYDVDNVEDLRTLSADLAPDRGALCPHTWSFMQSNPAIRSVLAATNP